MIRIFRLFAALLALVTATAALAEVRVTFHSFNGSAPFGRFPHTFVAFDGTLDATGERVHENFGWSAKTISPAILQGPVYGIVLVEKDKYLTKTNRHFTMSLSDAQYKTLRDEVERFRSAPGKYYSLESRNCIHFVGRMAELLGLKVDYPPEMLRKPRAWLNHIGDMNPELGAKHSARKQRRPPFASSERREATVLSSIGLARTGWWRDKSGAKLAPTPALGNRPPWRFSPTNGSARQRRRSA